MNMQGLPTQGSCCKISEGVNAERISYLALTHCVETLILHQECLLAV